MPLKADLHCHSTCSDGTLSPTELIVRAKEHSLDGLAITDHDTVDAYTEALPVAEAEGITLIAGVEFSTFFDGEGVHILGYNIDVSHPTLVAFCERHRQRREQRNRMILQQLAKHGMVIDETFLHTLATGKMVGRPHIAYAMIEKGYVRTLQQAFNQYIGNNKCCYVTGEKISLEETVEVIHAAGGVAVLAHPHLMKKKQLAYKILDLNILDGIEGYYAYMPQHKEAVWIAEGRKRSLLITGGSDFHGDAKPQIQLGISWAPEETFRQLKGR